MPAYSPVRGDPAPWFTQRATTPSGQYSFDMAAGRFILLYFFPSATTPGVTEYLDRVTQDEIFRSRRGVFFGISADPADETEGRLTGKTPGTYYLFDADNKVAALFGVPQDARRWVLVDPMLRIRDIRADEPGALEQLLHALHHLPDPAMQQIALPTPALILPDILEPELCNILIEYYHSQNTTQSGVFTEQVPGLSKGVTDMGFKRRRDCTLRDRALVTHVQSRIIRRVVPEVAKYFQFHATRMERMVVACYDSADRGCFGPHRDNTVTATAHRRFAVSINLNDDFEGGDLSLPEFGPTGFRAPLGGAIVFSCSVLHAVSPVTQGRRYAFLPFIHDEAAHEVKLAARQMAGSEKTQQE